MSEMESGVWPGVEDDFYGAAAEIYFEAVADEERDFSRAWSSYFAGSKFLDSAPQIWSLAISACASSREPLALARVKAVSIP